jgi:VWFA-related protein
MRRALIVIAVALLGVHVGAAQGPPVTQAQQRPVFRGGTHFVRVDAYPLRDGKIVEGLEVQDFEVFEDGKPQAIESFDFVKFDTFTPDAERRDPATQPEGFDLASDPRNRVFVVFVDMAFSQAAGAFQPTVSLNYIAEPLAGFLERILTPKDLYGFLTSRNSVKDLVLQRKTTVTREQIADMWRSAHIDKDDADPLLQCVQNCRTPEECDAILRELKARYRADLTYNTLDDLVRTLGSIRQERKSVILATDLLPRWGPNRQLLERRGPVLPPIGGSNGRVTIGSRRPGETDESYCATEVQRLAFLDFDPRFKDLLREARRQNVSFYPITPAGLQAPTSVAGIRAVQSATDDFRSLADETDGIAVVNTNDLNTGIKRIADDLAAYYVLGYYTTNTKFDGGIRNIKVRLKSTGKDIRARRQYVAPTEAEIAALAAPKPAAAPAPDPRANFLGEPALFLNGQSTRALVCSRTDRVRIEFPRLSPLDGRVARLLDSRGQPLAVPVNVADDEPRSRLILTLSLAPLARGTYSVELTATASGLSDRRLVPLQVQ